MISELEVGQLWVSPRRFLRGREEGMLYAQHERSFRGIKTAVQEDSKVHVQHVRVGAGGEEGGSGKRG